MITEHNITNSVRININSQTVPEFWRDGRRARELHRPVSEFDSLTAIEKLWLSER